ncbi:hypothetical protein [Patiriisocius sp. Uisw_017]|jgi:hypothetical protein|uniref:hypothetical protein n=1 Tax=Patiriisocius sp. Uisw_017 TaxID=3230968 RepID=UPI0039ED8997
MEHNLNSISIFKRTYYKEPKKSTNVVLAIFVNARGFDIAILEDALTVLNV